MFRSGNSRVSPTLVMATGLGMSTFSSLLCSNMVNSALRKVYYKSFIRLE